MRASYSIAAVALLCHQALAQCSNGLTVLAGNQEVSDQCSASVSEDAVALCSSYLATSTVYNATATPVAAQAAVATTTKTITSTRTAVVFTINISTETEVIISTATATVTAAASPGPIGRRQIDIDLNLPSDDSCPTLTSLPTDSVSGSDIRSACNCLGVNATATATVSAVSTVTLAASSTVTKSVTVLTTTTSTSTIVAYVQHTKTTEIAETATQTASYDRCSVGYHSEGNGEGNGSVEVEATSSRDCCEQCQQKLNCVASVYTGTTCELLVKESQLAGAETSDQCPLGIEDYAFGDVGGIVYPGPCGY